MSWKPHNQVVITDSVTKLIQEKEGDNSIRILTKVVLPYDLKFYSQAL